MGEARHFFRERDWSPFFAAECLPRCEEWRGILIRILLFCLFFAPKLAAKLVQNCHKITKLRAKCPKNGAKRREMVAEKVFSAERISNIA